MDVQAARTATEAAARQSYGRLVAYLATRSHDVAGAEDALGEAFAKALAEWPQSGVPIKPEAWLLTVARRRQVDTGRRRQTAETARDHLIMIAEERDAAEPKDIPDERLQLIFVCAHPAIDPAARAPLILQTILGLDAAAIARAFLVAPATMSQRLVRAKTRIRDAGIPFRIPGKEELLERLDAVLSAIYAAFSEGWLDAVGTETVRRELASEAIWLGRLVASLMPDEPEALGLLALMLYAEARRAARRDRNGAYVPLRDQDTALWNAALIDEAESVLRKASSFGATGRFQLEAAVQSVHCARLFSGSVDWPALLRIYDILTVLTPSPVTALNRAAAMAEIGDLVGGLAELDRLSADGRLAAYQPYWATRAQLLARLGRTADAAQAFDTAIALETDQAVRDFLAGRRATLCRQ